MAKIQNISKIHPTLGFTEFDILEKYRTIYLALCLVDYFRDLRNKEIRFSKCPIHSTIVTIPIL